MAGSQFSSRPRKESHVKKTLDITYRVLRLPASLLDAMRKNRDESDSTNIEFVAEAVSVHLPRILDALRALGLGSLKGKRRPARLPFSAEADTLKTLRAASNETSISAIQLLAMCLFAATNKGTGKKKRGARSKRSDESQAAGE
jgi:hypothetical protein